MKKYHYVYRITRRSTRQFYIGCHSTNDLFDQYIGSGKTLRKMYKELGIVTKHGKCINSTHYATFSKHFVMVMLNNFTNSRAMYLYEAKVVTPSILKSVLCLNRIPGGKNTYQKLKKKKLYKKKKR